MRRSETAPIRAITRSSLRFVRRLGPSARAAVAHWDFAPVFVFDRGFARAQYVLSPLLAKGIPFVMRVPRNVSVQTENGWCRVDTLPTGYQADVLYQKTQKLPVTLAVHRDKGFDAPMVPISTNADCR